MKLVFMHPPVSSFHQQFYGTLRGMSIQEETTLQHLHPSHHDLSYKQLAGDAQPIVSANLYRKYRRKDHSDSRRPVQVSLWNLGSRGVKNDRRHHTCRPFLCLNLLDPDLLKYLFPRLRNCSETCVYYPIRNVAISARGSYRRASLA